MQDLFARVLSQKDLSKAGDLFSLDDKDIENDLSEVLKKIQEITDAPEYLTNDNDQSVVEICITRVTSAIRENGSIERHARSLVELLESCLKHNLRPSNKDEDPPHAKIASDVMSCIFLNYSKKPVMELSLPTAVKFLHQNNRELSRNLSSYLSLAAIDNSTLLAKHIAPILHSIIAGNHTLARLLPQIYSQNKEPIQKSSHALIQLLLHSCEPAEKSSLLQLCGLVAKDKPRLLEKHIPQFCEQLTSTPNSPMVLQMFVDMARAHPEPFLVYTAQLRQTAHQQPATLPLIAQIYGQMGRTNKKNAKDCALYLVSQLAEADNHCLPTLLQEVYNVGEAHPSVLSGFMPQINQYSGSPTVATRVAVQQIKELLNRSTSSLPDKRSASSQTEGIVTVITVGNPSTNTQTRPDVTMVPRSSLATLPHSKNASTSTREINFPVKSSSNPRVSMNAMGTTMTLPPPSSNAHFINMVPNAHVSAHTVTMGGTLPTSNVSIIHTGSSVPRPPSATIMTTASRHPSGSHPLADRPVQAVPHTVIRTTIAGSKAHTLTDGSTDGRRPTVTTSTNSLGAAHHGNVHKNAIPFRDAVQQFCEKHLDKIKTYIDQVGANLPLPIKATLEETKHKKHCKLHFICFGQDDQCLYSENFFTLRTRHHRTWIHTMFLAIQARSEKAVSQQDPSVGNLKACWDGLKTDSGNSFVRLVTSNFPSPKDQDALINELHDKRFFDIFEFNGVDKLWACFMCIHPEKVTGLMKDGEPSIEGQLKEKKGKWKFFKRWKTRHFTLTGMNITYNKKDKKASLPVTKIQSVKTIRKGARDIPKAFEIFTNDETYVLKAKDTEHAEKWIQCLQIAVARTKTDREQVTDFDIQTWDFEKVAKPKSAPPKQRSATTTSVQTPPTASKNGKAEAKEAKKESESKKNNGNGKENKGKSKERGTKEKSSKDKGDFSSREFSSKDKSVGSSKDKGLDTLKEDSNKDKKQPEKEKEKSPKEKSVRSSMRTPKSHTKL